MKSNLASVFNYNLSFGARPHDTDGHIMLLYVKDIDKQMGLWIEIPLADYESKTTLGRHLGLLVESLYAGR